jgi:hypothetical protein
MADIKKTIDIQVNTNSAEVQKDFNTIRKLIQETEKAIEDLSKAEGDNSKEMDKLTKKLGSLNNEYKKLSSTAVDLGASFEDINGEVKPLTAQLGELEDRLYALALAGQQNSQEFALLTAEAGRYRQAQIQTDLAVDSAAKTTGQKLAGALEGAAGAFAIAQGAAGLFGSENENVEKALLKVQSALALVQGITAFKQSIPDIKNFAKGLGGVFQTLTNVIAATGLFGKAQKAAAVEAKGLAAANRSAAAAETQAGVAGVTAGAGIAGGMTLASIATTAFVAVLSAAGIGLIFAGIAAAVEFFSSAFESASDKSAKKSEELSEKLSTNQDVIQAKYDATAQKIANIDLTGGSKKEAYKQLEQDAKEYLKAVEDSNVEANRRLLELDAELREAKRDGDKEDIKELQKKYDEQKILAGQSNTEVLAAQGNVTKVQQDRQRNAFKEENKGLEQQIARKKAAGEKTVALEIEYKRKQLEAIKKFAKANKEEEEKLANDIIALQKQQADDQRAEYEKAVGIRKANNAAVAALNIATLENQKAAALAAAKTDADRLKIEQEYYQKIKEAKTKNINDQAALDKSLAKTAKERDTIEKNRLTALKQLDTDTINETKRTTDAENKIKLDGLNESVRIAQEKLKNSEDDFELRIELQKAQNAAELEQLNQQGKDTTDVVKRQAKELNDLRRQLAAKAQGDEIKLGNIKEETNITNQIIALKRNEGETLADFAKRRADLETKLRKDKLNSDIQDIDDRLNKEVEIEENGVKKKVKAVKEGSEEELNLLKEKSDKQKQLSDDTLANDLENEEKRREAVDRTVELSIEAFNALGDAVLAILEAQTAKIEEEYAKRTEDLQKQQADQLNNQELTAEQRVELERMQNVELEKLEQEKQDKLKEIRKKQANIELTIALGNIAAQTALAIVEASSYLSNPITAPLYPAIVALLAGIGAAQAATAIAQRAAIQGLARGGMVYGPGTETSDDVPIMASNGEAVINAKAVRKFAPVLSAINESTGGAPIKPNFYAAGGVVSATPGEVTVNNLQDIAAVAGQSAVRAYILDSDVTSQSVKNARLARQARIK